MTVTRRHQAAAGRRLVAADPLTGYGSSTITDASTYSPATFPAGGTSGGGNPSAIWEADTGGFYGDSGWGYSGTPAAAGTRFFFRANTRSFEARNQLVRWKYKSADAGADGYTIEAGDAVDVWLRYRTQFDLYVIQFDRADNEDTTPQPQRVYAKRKVPALNWTGPGGNGVLSNDGRYYYVPCDQGGYFQTYTNRGVAELAHDSATVYQFEASIVTLAPGVVQLALWRDGVFIASWTDDHNNGLAPVGSDTLQDEFDAGHFTSVTGYQASWYAPIETPGATGWRSDNRKCWFKDFELYELA